MANKHYCDGCKHCTKSGELRICTYFLDTSIRRPCPGGEDCTVRDTGKKMKAWSVENNATWEKIIRRREEIKEQRKQKRMRTAVCAACGEEFVAYDVRTIYCSNRCKSRVGQRKKYQRDKERLQKETKIPKLYAKVCPVCGVAFTTTSSKKIYCCRKCNDIAQGRKKTKWWIEAHRKENTDEQ